MNGISNDYIAMKLYQARQQDLERETKKDKLVNIALEQIRLNIKLPKIKISKN